MKDLHLPTTHTCGQHQQVQDPHFSPVEIQPPPHRILLVFDSDEWIRKHLFGLLAGVASSLLGSLMRKSWPSLYLGTYFYEVQTGEDSIYTFDSMNLESPLLLSLTPDLKPERCPLTTEPMEPWVSLTQPFFHACHWEMPCDYIPWCYCKSVRCIHPGLLPGNPGILTIWASTQLQGSGGLWMPYRLQMEQPHLPGK